MSTEVFSFHGHVAIPRSVQRQLNLKPGMEMSVEVQGDQIVIRKTGTELPHWSTMQGMAQGHGDLLADLEAEHAAELTQDDERLKSL